jgi:hypothetical protein
VEIRLALILSYSTALAFCGSLICLYSASVEAGNKVERLRSELAGAEAELQVIEARGDSVQRLTNAVRQGLPIEIQKLADRHWERSHRRAHYFGVVVRGDFHLVRINRRYCEAHYLPYGCIRSPLFR